MRPADLLAEARRLVEEPDPTMHGTWGRAAAILAREALEQAMSELLLTGLRVPPSVTFRARLLVLGRVVDDELARDVAWAWSALSAATHPQAYALPPTGDELLSWMEPIARLVAAPGRD